MTAPLQRCLIRRTATATVATTAAGLVLLGLPLTEAGLDTAGRSQAMTPATDLTLVSHKARHPHRKIKLYRVRPGDTAGSVAVRFHAWTAQLVAINHTSTLYVGEVIRIPVVVKAARKCTRHRHHLTGYLADNRAGHHTKSGKPRGRPAKPNKPHKPHKPEKPAHRHPDRGWVHEHASRAEVRHLIVQKARRVGVDPQLALAIAWQESGWQHGLKSSAGALGAMQVIPGTGRWMSAYLGRDLNLRNLHDNISAGVNLIDILREEARRKHAIAGYYQGLAGVRRHGMYRSTKRYVANVLAIKKALERGWDPA
jgi:LysM repeat protein